MIRNCFAVKDFWNKCLSSIAALSLRSRLLYSLMNHFKTKSLIIFWKILLIAKIKLEWKLNHSKKCQFKTAETTIKNWNKHWNTVLIPWKKNLTKVRKMKAFLLWSLWTMKMNIKTSKISSQAWIFFHNAYSKEQWENSICLLLQTLWSRSIQKSVVSQLELNYLNSWQVIRWW